MSTSSPKARVDGFAAAVMVAVCLIWGLQQVAAKFALDHGISPTMQALVRSAVAGPLVVGWVALRRGRAGLQRLVARDGTLGAGSLAAGLFALEFVFLFEGMRRGSASGSVVILYTAAFFTAVGAHFLVPGERLRPVNVAGLLIAFAGVAATIGGGTGRGGLGGSLLVLLGAGLWGMTTVVIKRSRALAAAPAEKVLGYQLLGSIPVLVAVAWAQDALHWPAAGWMAWAALLFQSVVVAFASYLVWFWLIGRYPAGRLAAFTFLTPLFAVALSAVLLGEAVGPMLVVGLVCVGVGLRLVNR